MIVDQAALNNGFWRPLNMAARAETPVTADKMASVIHRAIKEKPNEIRTQYKKGDP
jgi:N-methylhydantoinase B/oxoprolinase/acetone carboxylase alpha subunit